MKWAYAEREEDARALRKFVCTDAAPATLSEEGDVLQIEDEWEYEVQVELQEAAVPPPLGDYVLLGRLDGTDGDLAAASWWGEIKGPAYVRLFCIGVAARYRRTGLYLGDAVMEESLRRIAANARDAGCTRVAVEARVDHSNELSQGLMLRHGFTYIQNDAWYQQWWLRIDL